MIIYRVTQFFSFAIFCFLVVQVNAQQIHYRFDFGPGTAAPGYTQVNTGMRYEAARGYGFEDTIGLTGHLSKRKNALKEDYITGNQPFYFSVKLTEGNYRVKVLLGDANGTSLTTIKAENRRLMVEKAETKKGRFTEQEFIVHVRDSMIRSNGSKVRLKTREHDYLHWDDKLTLEFSNRSPKLCAIEITPVEKITTVFLAGNSTVVDQAHEPYAAWGQMIPSFFNKGVVVANYAESGETLKSFKGARRLEKIWSMAREGDYLFIEFAHNDQKPGGNHLDPFTTYKQTLKDWIAEARKLRMIPVLVTSMHRRNFDSSGRINNTLGDYPEAVRQTGKEEGVAVIDLNAMSKTLYEAWGPAASIKAFVHYPPNSFPNQAEELKDNTHFSNYGAMNLARCVARGISENIPKLAAHLKPSAKNFDPSRPDPYASWQLPASSAVSTTKPDGN